MITLFDPVEYLCDGRANELGTLLRLIYMKEKDKCDIMKTFHKFFWDCIYLCLFSHKVNRVAFWQRILHRIPFVKICSDAVRAENAPSHLFDPMAVDLTNSRLFRERGTGVFNLFDILVRPVAHLPSFDALVLNHRMSPESMKPLQNRLLYSLCVAAGGCRQSKKTDMERFLATFVLDGNLQLDRGRNELDIVSQLFVDQNLAMHADNFSTRNFLDESNITVVDYLLYICKYSVSPGNHPLIFTRAKNMLLDCLENNQDPEIIDAALNAIWCLSFFYSNRVLVKRLMVSNLEALQKHSNSQIVDKTKILLKILRDVDGTDPGVKEVDVVENFATAFEILQDPDTSKEEKEEVLEVVEKIRELCQNCKKFGRLNKSLTALTKAIDEITFSVGDILVQNGLHDVLTKQFFEDLTDEQISNHLHSLWKLTYLASSNFGEQLLQRNFCSRLIDYLERQKGKPDFNQGEIYKNSFMILFRLVLFTDNASQFLKPLPLAKHFKIALDSANDSTRKIVESAVALVLSSATISSDRPSLQSIGFKSPDFVPFYMGHVAKYTTKYGFYNSGVVAYLDSLSYLATNEQYAKELIQNNVLGLCWHLIQGAPPEACLIKALELMWTLAFTQQDAIKKCPAMLFRLNCLEQHHNSEVVKHVNSIKTALNIPTKESNTETHVMVSYCWSQKQEVHRLSNALKEAGKNVWIDVEKMEGDTFQRMAEGVENAHVIICCTSEDYFNSYACHKEAGYAGSLKKNIIFAKFQENYKHTGWLGLLQGAELYYDMLAENGNKFDDHVASILARISKFEGEKKTQHKPTPVVKPVSWWEKLGIQNDASHKLVMDGFSDKEIIEELRRLKEECPGHFLEFCRQDLKMISPDEIVRFNLMLRSGANNAI